MNNDKLKKHIKLCIRNLKSDKIKCCANCPFEEEILNEYPELKEKFIIKKERYKNGK